MKLTFNLGNNNYNREIGRTIEEKMNEYNDLKEAAQNIKKNKAQYNDELARTSWGKVLLVAIICILVGGLVMYSGINNTRKAIANNEDKVYTVGRIDYVRSRSGSNGGTELDIEYEVDGKKYESRIVTSVDRNEFMIGQRINIFYYKDNPSRIYSAADEANSFAAPVIGAIFFILGFVIIFAKVKAGNKK